LSEKISHSTCWLYNPGPVLVPQHYTLFICYKPVFTVKMGCENGHDEALETPDSGFPTPQSPSVLGSYDCYRATSTSSWRKRRPGAQCARWGHNEGHCLEPLLAGAVCTSLRNDDY
jgi:hypothetical protein